MLIDILDSTFIHVPFAITTHAGVTPPNIVLDNLLVEQSESVVLVSGGATVLEGLCFPTCRLILCETFSADIQ